MKFLLFLYLATLFTSCASRHELMRGTVAMKINEAKGVACLETKELKKGEKLFVMNNDCSKPNPLADISSNCQLVKAGEVEVVHIMNEHYIEFKAKPGVTFSEGSLIRFK